MGGSQGPQVSTVDPSTRGAGVTASGDASSPVITAPDVEGGLRRHWLLVLLILLGLSLWLIDSARDGSGTIELALAVGTSVVIYTLCLRYGVWRWLSAVGAAPALFTIGALGVASSRVAESAFTLVTSAAILFAVWSGLPLSPSAPRWRRVAPLLVGAAAAVAPFIWWAAGVGVAGEPLDQQSLSSSPGSWPLLICLVLGLVGAVGLGRAEDSGLRLACLLTTLAPVGVLWVTATNGQTQWEEQLPIALLPAAGVLGFTALARGRRGPAVERPQIDEVDRSALADFDDRYDAPDLATVAVVIAAYNEAEGLPDVLASMPQTVCGLGVDVIVVDDGSIDATAQVAESHPGAFLVAPAANRGQGAALRLGYWVARTHGAEFIITTDADGQYDPADFPVVLAPIAEGRADFVTGSRRRGHQETRDKFRRAGVHVFGTIVSAMTGKWSTDTSFGLRAMRAELTAHVTLNQPQYQSSELLLGAHSHGFRVAEVPGRMRVRSAGSSKKGKNLVYGWRYARVVFGTWWREACPSPAREHAPALQATASSRPTAAETTDVGDEGSRRQRRRDWMRRHRPFIIVLALAIALRVVVVLAFTPALIHSDARTYLLLVDDLEPHPSRPVGYVLLLLRPLALITHNVALVALAQHLLGIATAVVIYALMRRWGARSWVATLATLPLLLDSMQLILEHTVLSDVLFDLLVVCGVAVLAWQREITARWAVAAGLLLGTSATVRLVGEPLLVAAVLFCLFVGSRWRSRVVAAVAVTVGFAVPVAAYATWYHQEHGVYALSEFTGKSLYLRSTTFVECDKLTIPDYQRVLCPTDPVGQRHDPTFYVFSPDAPLNVLVTPPGVTEDEALREFAYAAMRAQPVDYLQTVARDFYLNFNVERVDEYDYNTAWKWEFKTFEEEFMTDMSRPVYQSHGGELESHQPWADFLVQYQKYGYLAGPLLLGCLVLGLAGAVFPGRNNRPGLRPRIFLLLASGAGLMLVPDVTAEFVWRYQLPALALLPAAAALAYTSLHRDRSQPGTDATASTD
jgi:hypothetical protein